MPTKAEWAELIEHCTWTWTSQNRVEGRLVTASNGNSIFLPAAGAMDGSNLYGPNFFGRYWSSSVIPESNGAWNLCIYDDTLDILFYSRCIGYTVRAVND